MKKSMEDFLFAKHILVSEGGADQIETIYALRNKLNIVLTQGHKLANIDVFKYAAHMLGEYVPTPFYRGFPRTVRELSADELLFDQLMHYVQTYGFGDFETAGHSLLEGAVNREEFGESVDHPHEFRIMTEAQAISAMKDFLPEILASTRPLNDDMYLVVLDFMSEYNWKPETINSKQIATDLLVLTRDLYFAKYLKVTDFIKVVDTMQYRVYNSKRVNKLHLENKDRKLLTCVLDKLLENKVSYEQTQECMEKRDLWKGVLHHLHYAGKTSEAKAFVGIVFEGGVSSVYSAVEGLLALDPVWAAAVLANTKGNGALLRNLCWLMSRTKSEADVNEILNMVESKNPLVVIQLQDMFRNYNEGQRYFTFKKHGKVVSHRETAARHILESWKRDLAVERLEDTLKATLSGKLGKVYIAPGMEKIAVPMNLSAGQSGFGIMPTGSRIAIPAGKKIRAFTYWEKVNDIDLSCFGIGEDDSRIEFSWRTMWGRQSDAIAYSGDETSGYNGGSEYFDIDFDALKEEYPKLKYMVFCNNVYSDKNFDACVCRAGWMSRDIEDSGAVYEPKTVKSAYTINAKARFCYLFALDLEKREVIWLNVADEKRAAVAGTTGFDWLYRYFTATDTMNMRKLYRYAATEVVETPAEADLVVGDVKTDKPCVKPYEFEKVFSLLA